MWALAAELLLSDSCLSESKPRWAGGIWRLISAPWVPEPHTLEQMTDCLLKATKHGKLNVYLFN